MYRKWISSIMALALFILLCIPGTTTFAKGKVHILKFSTEKHKYTHSEKNQTNQMDWKIGLKNYQKSARKNKKIQSQKNITGTETKTAAETSTAASTDPVTYNGSLRQGEIHYYRFVTSTDGVVDLTVTGKIYKPDALITNLDGTVTYNQGDQLPAGEYLLVVKDGNGLYTATVTGLTYSQMPDTSLPNLNVTNPATYSHRLSIYDTSFSFEGNTDAESLTFGVHGSNDFKPLPQSFVEQVFMTDNSPTYNYYGFLAKNQTGNSLYRMYEIIYPSAYRIDGNDRYEVSAYSSRALTKDPVKSVTIARGDSVIDAVTGGPLAGLDSGPILLTAPTALPVSISEEIKRIKPETAYIVGGTGSVSSGVEQEIKDLGVNTVRFDGANRFEVSAKVADYLTQTMNSHGTSQDTAFIANGSVLTDATAALSVAIEKGIPVLYVSENSIPDSIDTFIKNYPQYKKFIILGGTGTVSDSVKTKLQSYSQGITVDRISGANRFDVNVNIIKYFSLKVNTVVVGRGDNVPNKPGEVYPDVISGAPLAAKYKGPILLTLPDQLPPEIEAYLNQQRSLGNKIDQMFVQGGPGSVSDDQLIYMMEQYMQ
ncbi:cell wall-binding repeat-containing protein [Paenactinomyces guangxiensis]|uniref:Cell wall-binding repeat-containing protein n=1 Tax=Paenactinomyces guangxiensis TaxID=1490290 RepID=A0A7W2A8N2_9BACL|nr:cell wall-binding repeat-containing protein [Paenactinomyces guangxiensis]MBA4493998.1 cell wall-binding repeat-containing protein [Paenactinomyces guangxiensis]MBH8591257.1 cell wall-binding repeat-containing protein [Paenactinomyces guangxiensis]